MFIIVKGLRDFVPDGISYRREKVVEGISNFNGFSDGIAIDI